MTEYTAAGESPIDKAQASSLHRNRKGLSPCQGVNFFDCLVPTSYLEIMDSQRQISILCQNKTKRLDVILPPSFFCTAKVLVTQSLTKMMSDTWYKPFLTWLSSISSQREHIWITFCPPATTNRRSSPPVHHHEATITASSSPSRHHQANNTESSSPSQQRQVVIAPSSSK